MARVDRAQAHVPAAQVAGMSAVDPWYRPVGPRDPASPPPTRRRARLAMAVTWAALAASTPSPAIAQQATITMTADRTEVAVGERWTLEIRADAQGADVGDLRLPDLSAFQVVSTHVSRPMQFRFGFGGRQQVVQSTTVHRLGLEAVAPGRYEIAPPSMTVGGRTFRGRSLVITVRGDPTTGADPAMGVGGDPSQDGMTAPPVDGMQIDPQAFVRTVADRAEVYVGAQTTVTVYLYVRGGVRSSPTITREATADGFWVHDLLPPSRTLTPHTQIVEGTAYRVYLLRRFAAFPLAPGPLTIGPMELSVESGSPFDLFGPSPGVLTRRGTPLEIRAIDLPAAGRPAGPVAVGRYELDARLDKSAVQTGDAITLTARITGQGNIRDARLALAPVPGLRILEPQIRDDVTIDADTVGGSRSFEWLIVVQRPGNYDLATLSLNCFDPAAGTYHTVTSDPLSFVATGPAIVDDADSADDTDSPAGQVAGESQPAFGPIRTQSEFRRRAAPLTESPVFLALLAIPPATFGTLWFFAFVRRRWQMRNLGRAPQRAEREAKRKLFEARNHLEASTPRDFYATAAAALKGVLEARLSAKVGGMTHEELRHHLVDRGMAADLANRIVDELEGAEFARFSASGTSTDEMGQCLDRIAALLHRLDRFAPTSAEEAT